MYFFIPWATKSDTIHSYRPLQFQFFSTFHDLFLRGQMIRWAKTKPPDAISVIPGAIVFMAYQFYKILLFEATTQCIIVVYAKAV